MPSATQLIRQDHKKVEGLFKKFKQTKGKAKRRIAEDAMAELEVHATLEEEIFYPAVKKDVEDGSSMVQEATEEHTTVKELIAELKGMEEADEEFEARFSELVENVKHHVEEEQNEMLPKVEESDLDLKDLGDQMSQRKRALQNGGGAKKKRSGAAKKKQSGSTTRAKTKTTARSKSRPTKRKRSA